VTPHSHGISGRTMTMMGKPQFQALPSSFSKKFHENLSNTFPSWAVDDGFERRSCSVSMVSRVQGARTV
jgi:hypothetical protein